MDLVRAFNEIQDGMYFCGGTTEQIAVSAPEVARIDGGEVFIASPSYAIFFGATFCSIYAYKVVPLSMGPILEATSYIYVTIFGVAIFHEKLNQRKILALVLIVCGIGIYALTS